MLNVVRETIERHGLLAAGDILVVGVSGGPDSLCLLHLLVRLRDEFDLQLHAAHLDHQLRGAESAADAEFVRQTAAGWSVPCIIAAADLNARQSGVEEAARRARYAFLAQVAGRVGASKVAVGHNADDQAETVLMHLLRGAGLAGLRGMSPKAGIGDWILGIQFPISNIALIRPLLEIPRTAIKAYCQQHGLQPRFDSSNLDTTFFRNRLRHEVLPLLEEMTPGIGRRLRQLSELVAADYDLLESLLDEKWGDLVLDESDQVIIFDLAAWRVLPLSLRRGTLRRAVWRLRRSLRDLSFSQVEGARRVAETGETGAEATLPGRLRLSVSYNRLFIAGEDYTSLPDWPLLGGHGDPPLRLAIPGRTAAPGTHWQVETRLLPADSETRAAAFANQDVWRAYLDADAVGETVVLRPRRPGERFQPLGMGGRSASVADFMINCRIPAAWRDRVPILARPEHILWIAGWRLDERAKVTERTGRIVRVSFLCEDVQ